MLIHSYENYPNINIYFDKIKTNNLPSPKIITKILINKNPFKKSLIFQIKFKTIN